MQGMRTLLGAVALLLFSCGPDPRLAFVGSYSGTTEATIDGRKDEPFSITIDTTAPEKQKYITLKLQCVVKAELTDEDSFVLDGTVCPSRRSESRAGVAATYTDTITAGSGSLRGDTLTLLHYVVQLGEDYADGSPNVSFKFRFDTTATKR